MDLARKELADRLAAIHSRIDWIKNEIHETESALRDQRKRLDTEEQLLADYEEIMTVVG